VHTSTVTVAVLSNGDDGAKHPCHRRAATDFKIEWYSGSGAGGQHRNKHQNSVRLTHLPTGTVRKAETRSRDSSMREAMSAMTEALDNRAAADGHAATNSTRRDQVGSGMRGDKRRTYRFQDNNVVDHITGKQARCSDIMRGMVDKLWPINAPFV
jgi:peptide chain release factor 1